MAGSKIHDEASATDAEAGVVIIDGPGAIAISMTPDAATGTGSKLQASADKSRDQRAGKRPPFDPGS